MQDENSEANYKRAEGRRQVGARSLFVHHGFEECGEHRTCDADGGDGSEMSNANRGEIQTQREIGSAEAAEQNPSSRCGLERSPIFHQANAALGFAARFVVQRNGGVATECAKAADEVAFERMKLGAVVEGEARDEDAGAIEADADECVEQAFDFPVAGFFVAFEAEDEQTSDEKQNSDELSERKSLAEKKCGDQAEADGLKAVEDQRA